MSFFNTSYLMGNDTVGGWGPRYFFTFYSEFSEENAESTFEVIVLMVIFAASVVANMSIAWAVLRYREMRTVTNCFLLNLTVADLLFAVTTPALAFVRVQPDWPFGDFICRLLPYSQFVCGFVLLWTLTLISMDRHRCIVVPPYRSRLTPKRATVLTVFTWLIALAVFMPVPFWFHKQSVQSDDGIKNICTLVFPKNDTFRLSIVFTVSVVSLSCVLPLSLFVYHYQRIFHKLNKTRQRIEHSVTHRAKAMSQNSLSPPSNNGSMPQVLVRHEELRYRKHVRVVRVLLINVIVVLVMWLPITVVMCLIYVDGSRDTEDTGFFLRSHHFILGLLFALLNTVVNPILYGVLSENFRKCFARLWFISKRRRAMNRELLDNMSKGGGRTPSNGHCNSMLHQGSSASVVELPATAVASSSAANECW